MTEWRKFELPFDQFKRYDDLSWLLDQLRRCGGLPEEPLHILDIGGYLRGGGQHGFLPVTLFLDRDEVVVTDIKPGEFPHYVQADGTCLPFRDEAFDVVVSMDTLEHIAPSQRVSFISEAARVSRRLLVITGPFRSATNAMAESYFMDFLTDQFSTVHETLKEHLDLGLPELALATSILDELNMPWHAFPSGNIHTWLAMMILRHFLIQYDDATGLIRLVDRYYNLFHATADHIEPVYRTMLVGWLGDIKALRSVTESFRERGDQKSSGHWRDLFTRLLDLVGTHLYGFVRSRRPAILQEAVEYQQAVIANRDQQVGEMQEVIEAFQTELENVKQRCVEETSAKEDWHHRFDMMERERDDLKEDLRRLKIKLGELHIAHEELRQFRDRVLESPAYKSLRWFRGKLGR
ncbi:methyltransferase domain-containing protein [bacterium]|nr:methyltransferase domain-containing protein [candidate division CSSED10-310 bacterium]